MCVRRHPATSGTTSSTSSAGNAMAGAATIHHPPGASASSLKGAVELAAQHRAGRLVGRARAGHVGLHAADELPDPRLGQRVEVSAARTANGSGHRRATGSAWMRRIKPPNRPRWGSPGDFTDRAARSWRANDGATTRGRLRVRRRYYGAHGRFRWGVWSSCNASPASDLVEGELLSWNHLIAECPRTNRMKGRSAPMSNCVSAGIFPSWEQGC